MGKNWVWLSTVYSRLGYIWEYVCDTAYFHSSYHDWETSKGSGCLRPIAADSLAYLSLEGVRSIFHSFLGELITLTIGFLLGGLG